MSGTIKIPEPGVDESKWLVVGPAQVIAMREENAKLRDLLTDVLHGSRDHKLTDYEGPSLDPSLRNEIRAAVRPALTKPS